MIPKIIHYCWFGRGEKSKLINKCIASWKKYCPDYEIIEWNEDNFDVNMNEYVSGAYKSKKYAFVADYARLYAMYNYGGIYFDTDVELIKSPDGLLDNEGFAGFEDDRYVETATMGSEKGFGFFGELLKLYDNTAFLNPDGSYNNVTNVKIMTSLLIEKGFCENGQEQTVQGFRIYSRDYFTPFENNTGIMKKTENTVAIHWYDKSWISKKERIRSKLMRPVHRIFGDDIFKFLRKN